MQQGANALAFKALAGPESSDTVGDGGPWGLWPSLSHFEGSITLLPRNATQKGSNIANISVHILASEIQS